MKPGHMLGKVGFTLMMVGGIALLAVSLIRPHSWLVATYGLFFAIYGAANLRNQGRRK
jgi:hypothetical protein